MTFSLNNKAPYILSCALLSSAVLLSTGCSKEGNDSATEQSETASESLLEQTTSAAVSAVDSAKNAVEETATKATEVATDAKEAIDETATKVADIATETKEAVNDTVTKVADVATETTDKVANAVSNAKEAVVEKTEVVESPAPEQVTTAAVDGAKVFASCAGCHGSKAEGGVGPNLNAQTVADLMDKLNRYKAGEQIGPMSGMMTPVAKDLSDAEIKAVSEYVVTLK